MTKAQERARARRRFEKQAAAAAQREVEVARTRRVVGVVAVVLALVGAFVISTGYLRDQKPTAAATNATANPTTAPLAEGCTEPPTPLGTGAKLTMPDTAAVKGKTFTATLKTTCGNVEFTLDGAKAPKAVASFNQLASKDYWRDSPCHRLTTGGVYVLQCGDPTGTGTGTPGYGFGVENAPKDNIYPRGTVAMARTNDVKTGNGGQYFIVYKDTTLPGGYSIFGTVSKGMDIIDRIAAAGVSGGGSDGAPAAAISILSVNVSEKKG